MKKLEKLKFLILGLLFIGLYFVFSDYITTLVQRPVELKQVLDIVDSTQIVSSHLYDNSVVTWDGGKLKFYDKEGEQVDEILGNGHFTNIYYYDDKVGVLDKQLGDFYLYDTLGGLTSRQDLDTTVFSIIEDEDDIYYHKKLSTNPPTEAIYLGLSDREEELYTTDKFIVGYKALDNEIAISELTSENFAYRSILTLVKRKDKTIYNFDNETVLDISKLSRNKYLAITNKNLYLLDQGEKNKVEIDGIIDFILEDNKAIILQGNSLNIYNKDLNLVEQHTVDINPQGLIKLKGGYFVYGPTELIGFVGQDREFSNKFDSVIYDVIHDRDELMVVFKNWATIYQLEEVKK